MADVTFLLLICWALFALNGFAWHRAPRFHFTAALGGRRTTVRYGTWSVFSAWPTAWRLRVSDVPVALSVDGIANLPVGAAARPSPMPLTRLAWRWSEVREIAEKGNWLLINGQRFAPVTGHVSVATLRALAAAAPTDRARRLDVLLQRGLRPTRLRRLHRVLTGRTAWVASANLITFLILAIASIYATAGGPGWVGDRSAAMLVRLAPWLAGYIGLLHLAALVTAWRAGRKLTRVGGPKAGEVLGTPTFVPPQALQLRATLADRLWPAMHPLAPALAFAGPDDRAKVAFNVLTDLHWPLPQADDATTLAGQIAQAHRRRLLPLIEQALRRAGLEPASLVAAPRAEDSRCCAYCPRCHDQFILAAGRCPHGIPLQKLPR